MLATTNLSWLVCISLQCDRESTLLQTPKVSVAVPNSPNPQEDGRGFRESLPLFCVTWPDACSELVCWGESSHIPPRCTGCWSWLLWSTPWWWVWLFPGTEAETLRGTSGCQQRYNLCYRPSRRQPCFCVDSPSCVGQRAPAAAPALKQGPRWSLRSAWKVVSPPSTRHCGLLCIRHIRFRFTISSHWDWLYIKYWYFILLVY